ncbi:MAG: diacylglyceryl transferase [Bacteroidia bacterium]|nr:diacylglyceryl transferase [Bacteroidia bacterium]NNJ55762.1 diacylglyceryl transferase [Bacteroidia bacterium]
MKSVWKKLKVKWNIESDLRLAWIFVIFSVTGSSIVFVRKPVQIFLFEESDFWSLPWFQMIVITVIIYFVYQIHLFIIGSILGEFKFVKWFILKMNKRMFPFLIK